MLQPQTLLENLELVAQQVVEGFIIGLHKSPFHGFSVEFAEHRLYNHGDSLRHIDWRVYGRTNKLFVKRFEEETNLRCCLVIDTSASMHFPEDEARLNKLQFSCLAAASLLHLLKRQLDAAALALFDEDLHYFSECRSAQSHYRMLTHQLDQVLRSGPGKQTNAASALHLVADRMHKRSLVVVFSDMMDDAARVEELFAALQHLRYNKHEVILFHVQDGKQELAFEFEQRPYEFVDMETGEKVRIQSQHVKEQYIRQISEYRNLVAERCHQYRIDRVPVDLNEPVEQVLHTFLLKRNKLL